MQLHYGWACFWFLVLAAMQPIIWNRIYRHMLLTALKTEDGKPSELDGVCAVSCIACMAACIVAAILAFHSHLPVYLPFIEIQR